MRSKSLQGQLKQFLTVVARSGPADGGRVVLRELGVRAHQSMTYPRIERRFVVEFDPVWKWIGEGEREPGVLKFVEDHVAGGSTVFDVGAHVGEWTLLFSELVGSSGSVIGFEPDPVARASLTKNVEMNNAKNVRIEASSVSDRVGNALLAADRFGSGLSSIVRSQGPGNARNRLEVSSTSLDEYCESHRVFPDWVKIDAEGAEPLIVKGMRGLIETRHPSVILEFHSDHLSEAEKLEAWSVVTQGASSVEFLQSGRKNHAYLERLREGYVPDCGFLVVLVKY